MLDQTKKGLKRLNKKELRKALMNIYDVLGWTPVESEFNGLNDIEIADYEKEFLTLKLEKIGAEFSKPFSIQQNGQA